MKRSTEKKKHWVISHAERETKILMNWILKNYGPRCNDYCDDCIVCKAWKFYDDTRLF